MSRRTSGSPPAPERGSSGIEVAILMPGLLLLLGLIIAAGRVQAAGGSVEAAARDAARAASIARSSGEAQAAAADTARASLTGQGILCTTSSVTTDTAGFAAPLGAPATVSVDVACRVQLSDVLVPGLPGSVTSTRTSAAPSIRTERADMTVHTENAAARGARERGSVTLFVAAVVPRCCCCSGWSTTSAARSGSANRPPGWQRSPPGPVPKRSTAAATAPAAGSASPDPPRKQPQPGYLHAAGAAGAVRLSGPVLLHVTVTTAHPTSVLRVLGIDTITVRGSATANLEIGR